MQVSKSYYLKGRQFILTALLFVFGAAMLFAQPGRNMTIQAEGTVVDSKTSEPLVGVAVKVVSSDGGTGTFGISDADGHFSFEVKRPGKYSLEFSYVGYKELHKDVNLMPGRGGKLGTFKMKEDPRVLAEVEAVGHSQRIKQRGDTLAYNADAYKVQDGASAEELVGKMPGIEVTGEGVKAQGETVQKILVDGKEFFDNDVKMALRSLPAEVLESVNIFDKKSDQAEFTGIDDGETVKAMDLITKAYRRNGTFGKVFGGIGNNFDFDNGYWNTGFNINVFNGDRRFTFQGMSNNVNERNFSNDDMAAGGGMMGGRQWGSNGVARTNGIGVNYTDAFKDGKIETELSYFFNQGRTYSSDTTYTDNFERTMMDENGKETLIPASSRYSASSNLNHSMSHRIGGRITIKPSANDEIMIRPSLNFQNSDGNGLSQSRTWNYSLDQVSIDGVPQKYWDDVLSMNDNISSSESDSWNLRANVLWRHRLSKPGRTFSVNLNAGASGSESESQTIKRIKMGDAPLRLDNQQNNNDNNNSNIGGNMQWTEPLATGLNLSIRYDMSFNRSERETTIDFYKDENFSSLLEHDVNNSNTYTQKNFRNSGELGLSYNYKKFRANASVRLQNSKLDGEQDYFLLSGSAANGKSFKTSKSYFSVLPNVRIEYTTEGGTQFRINYRSNSNTPSINNLQESVNTTNPLSYSTGNPYLGQSTSHNLNFNMIYTNTETAQNFMIFGGYNATQDQISNQSLVNRTKETLSFADLGAASQALIGFNDNNRGVMSSLQLAPGASFTRPVNRDGYQSVFMNFGYGFPFDAIMSNVNLSLGGNYGINPSNQLYYFGDKDADGTPIIQNVESKTRSYSFNPRMHISSNISTDLNFNLMYSPTFQWVNDTNSGTQDKSYLNHNLNASLNWTFWNGFTTDQVLNFSRFGGSSQPEAIEQWIWNASLGKKFLKGNKAEIKLQAYDILGSNKGFSRSVGDSNITSTYRNFMPRYFLLTFTYKITAYKAGGNKSSRTEDDGFGGMPGGGFPGGGMPGGGRGGFGGGRPF